MGDELKEISDVFKALSENFRLRVLGMLIDGREVCVCKLSGVLRATNSMTSRHLAYLKRTRIVESRRKGQWMYYKLNPKMDPGCRALIDSIAVFITGNTRAKKDLKKLEELDNFENCKEFKKCKNSK